MSIEFAILGILSRKPSTGYELKKIFEDSSILYWSGNNNQIYKALLQLQEEELVESEVIHQESSPSKKVYTITKKGLAELKEWVLSAPEAPELKKPFLIQLAWSDLLNNQELNELLSKYENELKVQLLMEQEKRKRAVHVPDRSPRETLLWEMISKNLAAGYRMELDWVQEVRQKLFEKQAAEEEEKMNYKVMEANHKKFIEFFGAADPLRTEDDALDLVALCGGHDTNLLMIHCGALSDDFFNLKTHVAGHFLQKLVNYYVKTVAVIPDEVIQKGRFGEMAAETNKGSQFRMYSNREEAEKWLTE